MDLVGMTADVPVRSVDRAVPFYRTVLGRAPDLRPHPDLAEWVLRRDPELALRVVAAADATGGARVGLAVLSVEDERKRLLASWPDLAAVTVRPAVIATLELRDPDGNRIVLWQDLLPREGFVASAEPGGASGPG